MPLLADLKNGLSTVVTSLENFFNTLPFAVYNATPQTRGEGNGGPLQAEADGSLRISLATDIAGEDLVNNVLMIEKRYSYTHITTGANTIKGSPGYVLGILVGKAVASGTITVADATSGTSPAITIPTYGSTLLEDPGKFIPINATFVTGLTVTLSSGTWDVTVIWR